MSNFKKLYLAFSIAVVAIFWSQSNASAPTREIRVVEQKPKDEKKFRAPFLPKK